MRRGTLSNATRTTEAGGDTTLEDRLPELLDDVLGRLSDVGVARLVELAREATAARMDRPAAAHLAAGAGEEN